MVTGVAETQTRQRPQLALRAALKARDTIATSARDYDRAGRADQADRLRREAHVLTSALRW